MSSRKGGIEISAVFAAWRSGLRDMAVSEGMVKEWAQVNDVMFANTQRYVHVYPVRGGSLKASGKTETKRGGAGTIVGETTYGGGTGVHGRKVDYAIYEIARGGSHDFITLALNDTQSVFTEGVGQIAVNEILRRLK